MVAQWPNLPLWLFAILSGIGWLADGAAFGGAASIAARLCLVWWAGDELLRGVNPWRRSLGAVVLVWSAVRVLS